MLDIGIETHLFQISHTQQLISGFTRIDQWTQQIEDRWHLQCFASGAHILHGRMEELCMLIHHTTFIHASTQGIIVVGELHAMLLHHVAGTTDGRCSIIAMLSDLIASTSHHKARTRRDVEGILPIASCTHNVDGLVVAEVHRNTQFQQGFSESQHFIYSHASHLYHGEHSGDLGCWIFLFCNIQHHFLCFFLS